MALKWTSEHDKTLEHQAVSQPTQPSTPPVKANESLPLYLQPDFKQPAPVYRASNPPAKPLIPAPPALDRDTAARERMRRRRVQGRPRGGEWAWVIIAAALLGVVMVVSLSAFILLRAANSKTEIIPTAVAALPTPIVVQGSLSGNIQTGQEVTLSDGRSMTLIPWDGNSRFTMLIVGLDRRPGETGLAYRTDTMMLVSIDPATQAIGILSIPRDLYVEVPGYGELQRVNTPMVLGEIRQPGFGPQLMMQTVQYNLGIRIHDYVAVDFNTFITLVDAIGGIDMDVPYTLNDPLYPDMNYGYDPFYITAGQHHLDGLTALKYARTRHGDSDFQRAERQQAVLYAVRDKILNLNMLPQLIIQGPALLNQISSGISTGLQFDQLVQLALYLKDIPLSNIKTGVIDGQYTMNYTTSSGAQVLVPDRANIGTLMVQIFGETYSQ